LYVIPMCTSDPMRFWTHIFTPETWQIFRDNGGTVTGFPERYRRTAEGIAPGDQFLCYTARVATWTGILRIDSPVYIDRTPIFDRYHDPYIVRFRVTPLIVLAPAKGVAVSEVWDGLVRTRGVTYGEKSWVYKARLAVSPSLVDPEDAAVLSAAITRRNLEVAAEERR
jgi:hypothetical protein